MTQPPIFIDARHLERQPTGVGVWLRSILGEWAQGPASNRVTLLTRRSVFFDGLRVERVGAPFALWHLVAAWRTVRAGGRYLSPDSFIVPVLLGRRAAIVVHDLTPVLMPHAHTRRSRLSHRLLLRLAVSRAGSVIVPSEATASDLIGVVPRAAPRVRVVPEASRALPDPAAWPSAAQKPFVLYVGTIEPRKNVDILVRVFKRAAPDDWRLILAGKLGWLDPLARDELLRSISADERVLHLGYVDDAELASLYRDADLFVYPSSHEGFGLPVLEAMARGVATITSDAAALREVAGSGAVCVPLTDLEHGLEREIARLLASPHDRAALAVAGRQRAAAFSWAVAASATLDAVLSVTRRAL